MKITDRNQGYLIPQPRGRVWNVCESCGSLYTPECADALPRHWFGSGYGRQCYACGGLVLPDPDNPIIHPQYPHVTPKPDSSQERQEWLFPLR